MPIPGDKRPYLRHAVIELLYPAKNTLGEGAYWDTQGQRLLWVDILEKKVFVQRGRTYGTYRLPVMPSVIWKVAGDLVYLATEKGLGELALSTGVYRTVAEIEADNADTRSNDGGMAPDGSFWFGTMLNRPTTKGGAIYRVSNDFTVERMDAPVGIPNTFLFPVGGAYALIGDSLERCIYRYELNDGTASKCGVWMAKTDEEVGTPDGSALIDDRAVINAEWGSGRLVAYTMQGEPYDVLQLPVSRPTSCALNGDDDSIIYVTSARDGLTQTQLRREPLAGSVFVVRLMNDSRH